MSTTPPTDQPPKLPVLATGGEIRPIVPQSFEDAWRIALVVTRSGLAPYGLDTPEKAMVAIMHGLEVGLLPMASLQSIAVINGKPSIYGDGLLALVRRSGLLEEIKERFVGEGDALEARCTVQRKGDPQPIAGSFSVAQAKLSGLWTKTGKNNQPTPWQLYPKRMLQMRARAYALRDAFPDVLKGLAVREEMDDVELMRDVTPPRDDTPPAPPAGPPAAPPVAPEAVAPADVAQTWEDAPEPPQPFPSVADTGAMQGGGDPGEPEPTPRAEAIELGRLVGEAMGKVLAEPFDPETGELPPVRQQPDETSSSLDELPDPPVVKGTGYTVIEEDFLPPDDDLIPPIPPILDRRAPRREAVAGPDIDPDKVRAVAAWMEELENAFSGCEDGTSLVDEQRARMAPMKSRVSHDVWRKAEALLQNHVMRLRA